MAKFITKCKRPAFVTTLGLLLVSGTFILDLLNLVMLPDWVPATGWGLVLIGSLMWVFKK